MTLLLSSVSLAPLGSFLEAFFLGMELVPEFGMSDVDQPIRPFLHRTASEIGDPVFGNHEIDIAPVVSYGRAFCQT
jgi:hypothetical protein